MSIRAHLFLITRIALLAMLMASLAPTLSRLAAAMGTDSAVSWVEVCTASGSQWVAVPANAPSHPAGEGSAPAVHSEHCPFCLLSMDRWGPPTESSRHLFADAVGFRVLPVTQALFFGLELFTEAQPRAPPHAPNSQLTA